MRWAFLLGVVCMLHACSGRRELVRRTAEPPQDVVVLQDERDAAAKPAALVGDPNALLGIEPSQGPFSGGQLAVIRGNGFTSEVRVWFGANEVPVADVVALDPHRIQVAVPAGAVGPSDVSVQIAAEQGTRRTLLEAYQYDGFYVEPSRGPTRGGTRVTLTGLGNAWTEATRVQIDRQPCELIDVRQLHAELQELDCITPPGSAGAKVVSTLAPSEQTGDAGAVAADGGLSVGQRVTGAFSYVEEGAAFEGGLSGKALQDFLQVTVYDAMFGEPMPGVYVLLAEAAQAEQQAVTGADGVATFDGGLGPAQTVTVAGDCIEPVTVVDVPVDTLTLYVEHRLTPECIPPSLEWPDISGGAGPGSARKVSGSLSWGTGVELKQTSWRNVPTPKDESETQRAYVFELARDSRSVFQLPGRFEGVTTDERGSLGYPFDYYTSSDSNLTLYALAGLEQSVQGTRSFTPYVMGIVRGVVPGDEHAHPVIPMNLVLDQRLSLQVDPPEQTGRGPDRVELTINLRVGRAGFIPLPQTDRVPFLPLEADVEFLGLPPLDRGLAGAQYVISATAVTGQDATFPVSDLESLAARSTSDPVAITNFVELPGLHTPAPSTLWSGQTLRVNLPEEANYDLWTCRIRSQSDLLNWTVVGPRNTSEVRLPDLRNFGALGPSGPTRVRVSAARVANFNYGVLSQQSFGPAGWAAYAADDFDVIARPDAP